MVDVRPRSEFALFELKIRGTTPQELPLRELVAYLEKAVALFGGGDEVRLLGVKRSSAAPQLAVPRRSLAKVMSVVRSAASDDGPDRLVAARRELADMLRRNGRWGELREPGGRAVIQFPRTKEQAESGFAVTEIASNSGKVLAIGGKSEEYVPVMLEIEHGTYWNCVAKRDLARKIIRFYEQVIDFEGVGRWQFYPDSKSWVLKKFTIKEFRPSERISEVNAFKLLKQIGGNEWDEYDTPEAAISALKEEL